MKGNLSRMWRSGLSLLLALCMVVGMCPITAFAAESEETTEVKTIKYVSLGDSMTNGYGLTGYTNNGYKTYGKEAYPNQFADWLVANEYATSVEQSQLAMSAMRAEDLHFILEFPVGDQNAINVADTSWDRSYESDVAWWNEYYSDIWNSTFSVGDFYTWDEFTDNGRFSQNCGGTNAAAKAYQDAVANADIISMGTGNANFGVFLLGRIMNALGFNGDASEDAWIDIDRTLAECDAETKAQILALKAELENQLTAELSKLEMNAETAALVEPMVKAITYTVVSYAVNYAGVLERIMELNPDAEVILVGIMNTLSGMDMTIAIEGTQYTIPMNDVMSVIVEPVNTYIAALPAIMQAAGNEMYAQGTFYYAEAPEVECMVNTYEDALKNENSVVRSRFVEEIVDDGDGLIWSMVAPMFNDIEQLKTMGLTLDPIDLDDIVAYEAEDYDKLTDSQILSCAVYLAFEEAIVIGSKNSTISANSFVSLANGFAGLFDGVGAQLMAGLDMDAIEDEVTAKVTAAGAEEIAAFIKSDDNYANYVAFCVMKGLDKDDIEKNGPLFYCDVKNIASQDALVATFTAKYAPYYTALTLGEDITPVLTEALTSDDTLMGLLHLFGRMLIGNGLGAHPSVTGHNELSAAVIEAYETKHTVNEEVTERVNAALEELYKLIEEYGPEIAEQLYAYAEENGYIDAAIKAAEELEALVQAKVENFVTEAKPAIEAAIENLQAEAAALQEKLIALKAELEAKKAELEAAVGSAAEDVAAAIEKIEAAIAEIEAAIKAVEAKIAEIEAAIEELQAALDEIEAKLESMIEAAAEMKAAIENLIDTLKNAADASVEEIMAAIEAAREAVTAAVEAVETIYEQIETAVTEAIAMVEGLDELIANLTDYVAEQLKAALEALGEEAKEDIEAAIAEIQKAAEEAKAAIKAELEQQIADLKAELEPLINEKLAELEELKAQIEAEIAQKVAEIEAEINAKIAELEAALAEKYAELEALKAELENAAEELKAEIEAKIAEVEAAIAEIQQQIADLKAELEAKIAEIRAEVEAAYAEAKAELEKAIAELQAELEAKIAELQAAAEAKIAEIVAEAEKKIAELEAAVNEAVAELVAEAKALIEAAKAELTALVTEAVTELVAAAEAMAAELAEVIEAKIEEVIETVKQIYFDATHDDYDLACISYYVALGDGSAVSESYVDIVADELGVSYKNLAKADLVMDQTYAVLQANAAEIAKADLITLGYSNNAFTSYAVDQMYAYVNDAYASPDWAAYVGEENVVYVEQALEELREYFVESGIEGTYMGIELDVLMTLIVESYAYSYLSYACNMPEVINVVRKINSDAVVIVVGMYNPLDGVTIDMNGTKIAIGEYLEYLVDAVNVHATAYAMLTGNAIYVDAPEVETSNTKYEMTAPQFIMEYMYNDGANMEPNEAGHEYIAEQILAALNIDYEHFHKEETVAGKDATCTVAGLTDGVVCSVCGEVIVKQEEIPALGHDYVDGVCTRCGAKDPNYTGDTDEINVYRVYGDDRIKTSLAIAEQLKAEMGVEKFENIILASSEGFADALAGAYLATVKNAPIVLVKPDAEHRYNPDVYAFVEENLAEGGTVYMLGGEASIPEAVEDKLSTDNIVRLAGDDRYLTNLEILEETNVETYTDEILVCFSRDFADSLSASAAGKPILLVKEYLTAEQKAFLEKADRKFIIIGGKAGVSDDVVAELEAYGTVVTRLGGDDRYETSLLVAEYFYSAEPETIVLANSTMFPDALSGGPLAYAVGAPVVLTKSNHVDDTSAYTSADSVETGIVLGGEGVMENATVWASFDLAEGTVIPENPTK